MKIGILTQPLHANYGGLLQNYALQRVLMSLGHEVVTINRSLPPVTFIKKMEIIAKRIILRWILRRNDVQSPKVPILTSVERSLVQQNTDQFIREHIQITEPIFSKNEESEIEKYGFECYIVGSDQAWRPCYSPRILTYFLDFCEDNRSVKKIAYAVSFGTDRWEFSPELTERCARLAKQFTHISVRENTGLRLCSDFLGVNATRVLDPTMLLGKDEYIALAEEDSVPRKTGKLFFYILDKSPEKSTFIDFVSSQLKLHQFTVMPDNKFEEVGVKQIDKCIFPSVARWLRGFMDAEFVVTDSFHGTVFSLIFNKPFWAIGNQSRGLSRFESLLGLFGLENRLLTNVSEFDRARLVEEIDFQKVNRILTEEKWASYNFLRRSLES